jgi:tetratricopeptide (TPR) repeat protein
MKYLCIALMAGVLAIAPVRAASGQDPLAAAKDLYAAAQYEEALKALDALAASPPSPEAALAVQRQRALCLLALSRKAEAERAIEAVLEIDPFYEPSDDDAAPWVRTAFREVRQRVLPGALQQLYGRAKQAFDKKAWPEATAGFGDVLKLLDDKDLTLDKGAQADMRMVVQGFLDLAKAAAEMRPPAPPAGTQKPEPKTAEPLPAVKPADGNAGTQPATPATPDDPSVVYDTTAAGVVPPLPLRQSLAIPETQRPMGAAREGTVEIVISATGTVESAVMRQPLGGAYDALVLQAATGWRYRAAMKGGKPVRYRRSVRVVIPGR